MIVSVTRSRQHSPNPNPSIGRYFRSDHAHIAEDVQSYRVKSCVSFAVSYHNFMLDVLHARDPSELQPAKCCHFLNLESNVSMGGSCSLI